MPAPLHVASIAARGARAAGTMAGVGGYARFLADCGRQVQEIIQYPGTPRQAAPLCIQSIFVPRLGGEPVTSESSNYAPERDVSKHERLIAHLVCKVVSASEMLAEIVKIAWNTATNVILYVSKKVGDIRTSNQLVKSRTSDFFTILLARATQGLAWRRRRRNRCYERCASSLLDFDADSEWCLVHGTIDKGGGTLGHAWLQSDSEVYDPTFGRWLPIAEYVSRNNATVLGCYAKAEVVELILRSKHHGPWHGETEAERAHAVAA
jgi:hypothetical protein